jgi:hypothetical protein
MAQWKVPVVWQRIGYYSVEALDKETAIKAAQALIDDCTVGFPDDNYYVEDSLVLDDGGCDELQPEPPVVTIPLSDGRSVDVKIEGPGEEQEPPSLSGNPTTPFG